jgi:hypothetical protein
MELRPTFGVQDGKRRMTSVISKAAAFTRPGRFVAWDKFAKQGISRLRRQPGLRGANQFDTYAEFLEAFDSIWEGKLGEEIRQATVSVAENEIECQPRFQRRVMDVYLMQVGGRWDGD